MKRSAVGLMNGNWKGGDKFEPVPSRIPLRRELEIALEVQTEVSKLDGSRDRAQRYINELEEQLRILSGITPEAHESHMRPFWNAANTLLSGEVIDEAEAQAAELEADAEWLPVDEQVKIVYGESELKAQDDDWKDENDTRESVRP